MSTSLSTIARRQAERYETMKDKLQTSGYSYREYAQTVNVDNLEPRSQVIFAKLQAGIQSLAEPIRRKPSPYQEMSPGMG